MEVSQLFCFICHPQYYTSSKMINMLLCLICFLPIFKAVLILKLIDMNKKNNMLNIVITVLLFTVFSGHFNIVNGQKIEKDGLFYILDVSKMTAELSSKNDNYPYWKDTDLQPEGKVVIPQEVEYNSKKYTVTKIGNNAFYGCAKITELAMPNTITEIGKLVFVNCSGLVEVVLPNSVTTLKLSAFQSCTSLTTVTLPNSLTKMDRYIFAGCPLRTIFSKIEKPDDVTGDRYVFGSIEKTQCKVFVPNASLDAYKQHETWKEFEGNLLSDNDIVEVKGVKISEQDITVATTKTKQVEVTFEPENASNRAVRWEIEDADIATVSGTGLVTGKKKGTTKLSITTSDGKFSASCNINVKVTVGSQFVVDKLKYEIISTLPAEVRTVKSDEDITGDVKIPQSVQYEGGTYYVKVIGAETFAHTSYGITSITIPVSVDSIGEHAFSGCQIKSFEIPTSVKNIGTGAFSMVTLEKITLPNSITEIEEDVFSMCMMLKEVILPASVTKIGTMAFGQCNELKKINLTDNITEIGDMAFSGCGFESITIPTSVKEISNSLFEYCSNLTTVNLHNEIDSIGDRAFNNTQLKVFSIPSSVKAVGMYAFESCEALQSIDIPNSVDKIGDGAFSGCNALTKVNSRIKDVTKVTLGSNVFDGVLYDKCTLFIPDGTKAAYKAHAQWGLFTKVEAKEFIESVSLNEKVKQLKPTETFQLSVTITPDEVANKNVTWSSNNESVATVSTTGLVTAIAEGEATITVTTEDGGLTDKCVVTVKQIKVGDKFKEGQLYYVVKTVTPNKEVIVDSQKGKYGYPNWKDDEKPTGDIEIKEQVIHEGETYNIVGIEESVFSDCEGITSVSLPKTVTVLSKTAFYGCSGLKTISLPNTLTDIKQSVFYKCSSLESLDLPKLVKSIENGAFRYCSSLTAINVDEENQHFSSDANGVLFNNDKTVLLKYPEGNKATSYTVPNTVIGIGKGAFMNSVNITKVVLPNTVEDIETYAFKKCMALQEITIPEKVTILKYAMFEDCKNLQNVNLPQALKSIEGNAFVQCISLKTLVIPEKVQSLGYMALSKCTGLESIVSFIDNPEPSNVIMGASVFNEVKVDKCILYVPKGTKEKYKKEDQWKDFANIKELINVDGVSLDVTNKQLKVNETLQLTATVSPDNATNNTVKWISSNESVATVSTSGLVTAIAEGEATITVTTEDGNHTAECKVVVIKEVTGISDDEISNFEIYPTLVENNLSVKTNGKFNYLYIYTLTGMNVVKLQLTSQNQIVDVSGLKSGIYVVKVGDNVIKFVKK